MLLELGRTRTGEDMDSALAATVSGLSLQDYNFALGFATLGIMAAISVLHVRHLRFRPHLALRGRPPQKVAAEVGAHGCLLRDLTFRGKDTTLGNRQRRKLL